jgi:hypothetical protein
MSNARSRVPRRGSARGRAAIRHVPKPGCCVWLGLLRAGRRTNRLPSLHGQLRRRPHLIRRPIVRKADFAGSGPLVRFGKLSPGAGTHRRASQALFSCPAGDLGWLLGDRGRGFEVWARDLCGCGWVLPLDRRIFGPVMVPGLAQMRRFSVRVLSPSGRESGIPASEAGREGLAIWRGHDERMAHGSNPADSRWRLDDR